MLKELAAIGLRGKSGKRADEHEDDEDAKTAKSAEEHEDDEEEAKAAEDDEDEAKAEDDEDEKEAKAVASAAKAARINARAITALCALAGKPELAGEFIASGKSQAAVRRGLLADRADASGVGEIAGQTSPAGSPAASAVMWDKANEKNAKAMGLTVK